ncbi:MAG: 50S ribosomal protein L10 [Lentisphaerae bacterium]|nr:50S ribosomal protein L10 [Lentisphaerota bacterium]
MRIEKKAIIDEIRASLEQSEFVVMTDYSGMQVVQFNDLRRSLSGHGARLQVVKNTLFHKAVAGLPLDKVAGRIPGPLAVVTGGDGIEVIKELKKFAQANQKLAVKCAVFEGRLLNAEDVEAIAQLPAREVLYGMLAGTLAAPMAQLAGVMRQKLASLVYVLQAAGDKKSQS